jgi:ADP-ribose pyrophosphatase YjhB (NUDIX family)
MHDATLCYLIQGNSILLGLKKRGFGEGRWNGYGGKPNPGESIEDAVIREVKEEMNVSLSKRHLEKVAVIDFYFTNAPKDKDWDQTVYVFFARKWKGEPEETEEMRPQWFDYDKVPINQMWADDPYWLPLIIEGKKVRAEFTFGQDNSSVLKKKVTIVDQL